MAELTAYQSMLRHVMGFIPARAIYIAAKLEIGDEIGDGAKTAEEIAGSKGVNAAFLYRVLRMLSAIGVLKESAEGQFSLTDIGQTLRSDSPQSLTNYIILYHELAYKSFTELMFSVRNGGPNFAVVFGEPLFEHIQSNPDMAALFHKGLVARAKIEVPSILNAYDFSQYQHVIDVGGGSGTLLSGIVQKHKNVNGTLFELAPAVEAAKSGRGGPLPRCNFEVGDFFKHVAKGGDLYILKLVLHDFTDAQAVKILSSCRDAMNKEARLIVIEGIVGNRNELTNNNFLDLTMMTINNGMERSLDEYKKLFLNAQFNINSVIPTSSDLSIIELLPTLP